MPDYLVSPLSKSMRFAEDQGFLKSSQILVNTDCPMGIPEK